MAASFFFYDLETSGLNSREARIMQFAGQRTDLDLRPVGEPINELIKLPPDVLPEPGAVLVTGITPQKTLEDGITEAEFLQKFYTDVATAGTIFVGYNSVRFDDEFMRFLMWRNYYDAYEWQWKDERSRWDLLDVVRMTRALRPDGINWPFDSAQGKPFDFAQGKPSNRLELLTKANKIEHAGAHEALADVNATIALARLIKSAQPKLFEFLLNIRGKKDVARLVDTSEPFDSAQGKPFVYTSGKYASEFEKTTVAVILADTTGGAFVYDLRVDPDEFTSLDAKQLAERWRFTKDEPAEPRLPVKALKYNHCPAVAPMSVLDEESQRRLRIDLKTIAENRKKLAAARDFAEKVQEAAKLLDAARDSANRSKKIEAEGQLYDGFVGDGDREKLASARHADAKPDFKDSRLNDLWPRFLARNYPAKLSDSEAADWTNYCAERLMGGGETSRLANYFKQLAELKNSNLTKSKVFLIDELQLYGESIMPTFE